MSEITTVGGYELKKPVATGNASQVWEVVEQGGSTPFAMKLLLPQMKDDPEQVAVLKHEAKVLKVFEHPNIVRFHEVVTNKRHAFFIMDYFKAGNLKSQIVNEPYSVQSRLPQLVEKISMALQHVHEKGWVHRDIKPDNVLFNRSSEMRLIDFSLSAKKMSGLGKLLGSKQKTIQGTRTYIAPETILKQSPVPQTDMYSLGILIYEILTGSPPFRSSNPKELLKKHLNDAPDPPTLVNPNITPELEEFVLRLLSKKPAQRPQDMNEVQSIFRSLNLFHEDVMEVEKRETVEPDYDDRELGQVLDSRKDAERRSQLQQQPGQPQQYPQLQPGQPQPGQQQPGQPYPQHGQPQQYPQQPGQYPQQPGQPYPGQQPMYPGQPTAGQQPGQQYPSQQPAAQLPPGQYPQPGQPQQYPQQPQPGQQYPQQVPQPGQGQYPQNPQQVPPGYYPQQPGQQQPNQQQPGQYPQQQPGQPQPSQQQPNQPYYPPPGQQMPPGYYPPQPGQQQPNQQQPGQPPQQYDPNAPQQSQPPYQGGQQPPNQ